MKASCSLKLAMGSICLAVACAVPPGLRPLDPVQIPIVAKECQKAFLREPWLLTHSLEFELPGGKKSTAIGVIEADPRTRRFRTVLMTLEGWVLFDIEAGEPLIVHRAVPPFDSPIFAGRMAEDIGFAFFAPEAKHLAWGRGEDGSPVCRFDRGDGSFVDVAQMGRDTMQTRLYNEGQGLRKTVTMTSFNDAGLVKVIEIRSGRPSYAIRLRLIEAESITPGKGALPR